MSHDLERDDGGVLTPDREKRKERVKPPRQHAVVLLNDDFTTMDFVVEILKTFFGKTESQAARIMLDVHQKGKGVAGVYSKDIADTKAMQVCEVAQAAEFPLKAVSEPLE